jgi:hypothetical protein
MEGITEPDPPVQQPTLFLFGNRIETGPLKGGRTTSRRDDERAEIEAGHVVPTTSRSAKSSRRGGAF